MFIAIARLSTKSRNTTHGRDMLKSQHDYNQDCADYADFFGKKQNPPDRSKLNLRNPRNLWIAFRNRA
jgi:hypothetical protein